VLSVAYRAANLNDILMNAQHESLVTGRRRSVRIVLFVAITALAYLANADDYSTAKIVDAGQGTGLVSDGRGGVYPTNQNTLAIEMNGMRITATYETILASGKNAAANFIVGTEVQARIDKNNKWLYVVREDGKELRARITRRAIAD
jgi:hypothetical protein